jgi:membrane fusion protein (multidrug efflux system)
MHPPPRKLVKLQLQYALIVVAAACGKDSATPAKQAGPPPAAEVGVMTIESKPVTLTRELPGRTSAFRVAEVRARVNGIVRKRLFTEGSDVKAGQTLFEIDPAPYEAALQSAQAQQLRAEATVESATAQAERYTKLIETNAVSRQEYEDAVARLKTAKADVASARAAVKAAQINVDYTRVTSPIAGRIGRSEVTEGAYVQQSAATLLATVQQLDPVYVDLTWSSTEMMRMKRLLESGELQTVDGKAKVDVVLEDGRTYAQPGTLEFADVKVDPTTGSISLRAIVPNPKAELLPGMFVRARIAEGIKPEGLLVPQRAVTRDQNGRPLTMVVDKAGKVERRSLVTDRAVGDAWLVTDGLKSGEMVIVDGMQRVRPGVPVKPVQAGSAAAPAPTQAPPAGSGAAPAGSGAAPAAAGSQQAGR